MTDDVSQRLAEIAKTYRPGYSLTIRNAIKKYAEPMRWHDGSTRQGIREGCVVTDVDQLSEDFRQTWLRDVPWLIDQLSKAYDSIAASARIYVEASEAVTEALDLDPDDVNACVPGCAEGPAGLKHDIWHLTQQRDEARARASRVRDLHQDDDFGWCTGCEYAYPCATVRALDGAET